MYYIFSHVPHNCYILLSCGSHLWKNKYADVLGFVHRNILNYVPGSFVKTVHTGQRIFASSAVCEGNVMRREYLTRLNDALFFHRQTLRRAGIASRVSVCSLVPSGRLLHPTTDFKIKLIHNLCVFWLSKKCRDLSSTKQICPVPGISELHWGVAFNCSIRFDNNNNNWNKNWWLYMRYFLWNGLCRNKFFGATGIDTEECTLVFEVTWRNNCKSMRPSSCPTYSMLARHLVKATSHIPKPISPIECVTKLSTYKNATWEVFLWKTKVVEENVCAGLYQSYRKKSTVKTQPREI